MEPRLKTLVLKEIQPSLKEKFGYKNFTKTYYQISRDVKNK